MDFLDDSDKIGSSCYTEHDDCGGRECLIVWRNQQLTEVLFIDGGEIKAKKQFTASPEQDAFKQATTESLAWIGDQKPPSLPLPESPR